MMRAVLVVELEVADSSDMPEALTDTARRISDLMPGLPVRQVWAGINEVAAAVMELHGG
jgi:hypothetical protein